MKKTVNQSGITLIALVVTIVVLLILAGITITYVLAEGGLFDRAQNAAKEQTKANIMDYAGIAQSEVMIEYATLKTGTTGSTGSTTEEIFRANFPSDYVLGGNITSLTGTDDGKTDGDFTVTVGANAEEEIAGTTFKVTFENGVITEVSEVTE